ncbi:hypothetical protein K474DRAFT_1735495 [Panus rudis PR-1116 ss-1]|nr:hypothetical protein K474DRAFT_1735495 [Panus rudis PR-1116 ss-1]
MAFPVPEHLPRKKEVDVSTKLLTKVSETDSKALNFELASSWVAELDAAIQQTKKRIHDRIQADLPYFDSQLSSAKSVQERLRSLSTNVDNLSHTLSDPESGLIPKLVMTLSQHATLVQDVSDADARHKSLAHLSECKAQLERLISLTNEGKLPEAVKLGEEIEGLLSHSQCPEPLDNAQVMSDLRRTFRAAKDRAQEQLNEAYSRCVVVNSDSIIIRPSVPVRQSDTTISLTAILSSLTSSSLSSHITTLRRDLTTHYIDYIAKQPTEVTLDVVNSAISSPEYKLSLFPAPPNSENLSSRIDYLATLLKFLDEHLFPHLPPSASFPLSLSKPVTNAVLNHLLILSLPSSLDDLPGFLELTDRAVQFETLYIDGLLGDKSPEKEVKKWAESVGSHYERKRRVELLERARAIILRENGDDETFRAEFIVSVAEPALEPSQPPSAPPPPPPSAIQNDFAVSPPIEPVPEPDESAWGLEDGDDLAAADENWGFDEDVDPPPAEGSPAPAEPPVINEETEDAPAVEEDDPWALDESDPSLPESGDSIDWDDPWGEEPQEKSPAPTPKTASKLEKLSSKGKAKNGVPPVQSPNPVAAPPPTPAMPALAKQTPANAPPVIQEPEKETYLVSGRVKGLMFLVEDILSESIQLADSGVLSSRTPGHQPVGSLLGQTSAMVLDLYRGLYPVKFVTELTASARRAMGYSNDCLWTSEEVRRVSQGGALEFGIKGKLVEGHERLKLLSESWFEDTIDNQCAKLHEILDQAEGFRDTGNQDRFDECEDAVNQVLQEVRRFSHEVKSILPKTKYYNAIGSVVESALSRVLQDILALSDIPDVESHKLADLCRVLNALEALFVEDPNHPSFVVAYVPSWLKFSYLSELLEASIADISYLFEEGALVDFEIEELVKLVKALFADTPLRANTIQKLMHGHPQHS